MGEREEREKANIEPRISEQKRSKNVGQKKKWAQAMNTPDWSFQKKKTDLAYSLPLSPLNDPPMENRKYFLRCLFTKKMAVNNSMGILLI